MRQAISGDLLFIKAWFKKFGLDMPKWDPKVSPSVPNPVNPRSAPGSGKPGDPSQPSMFPDNKPGIRDKNMATYSSIYPIVSDTFLRAWQFFFIRLTVSRIWRIGAAINPYGECLGSYGKCPPNHLTSFFELIPFSSLILRYYGSDSNNIQRSWGVPFGTPRSGEKELIKMSNLFPKTGIHAAFDSLRRFPKVLDTIWATAKQSSYGICGIQRIDVDTRRCEVRFHDLRVKIGLRSGRILG